MGGGHGLRSLQSVISMQGAGVGSPSAGLCLTALASVFLLGWRLGSLVERFWGSRNEQDDIAFKSVSEAELDVAEQTVEQDRALGHRRLRKAETVLRRRTSKILLVIEQSLDDHNQNAILRTAEALGIHRVWIIEAVQKKNKKINISIARTSVQWLDIKIFKDTSSCIDAIRAENRQIWATDLSQDAECLYRGRIDFPSNGIALIVGKESTGVSEEMLSIADRRIYFPLQGWADSLNLSVATALVLQRLIDNSPDIVGKFEPVEKLNEIRTKWYMQLAKTPEQQIEFHRFTITEKRIAEPFGDLRRPNSHRENLWVRKKILRREAKMANDTKV